LGLGYDTAVCTRNLVLANGRPAIITFHLVASPPKVERHRNGDKKECSAELTGYITRLATIDGEGIEKLLYEGVVGCMKKDAGPNTVRFEAKPSPNEGQKRQHDGQQWNSAELGTS
jgi:hypothetical protein